MRRIITGRILLPGWGGSILSKGLVVFLLLAATSAEAGEAWLHLRGGEFDARIVGQSRDSWGSQLLAADLDGDGADDLVLGSHNLDRTENSQGGAAVFYGRPSWPVSLDLAQEPPDVLVLGADANDLTRPVDVGDLDGDGVDDLLLVALRGDGPAGDRTDAGEVSVLFGGGRWAERIELATDPPDVVVYMAPNQEIEAAWIQDIDADGIDDLLLYLREDRPAPEGDHIRLDVLLGRTTWEAEIDLRDVIPDRSVVGIDTDFRLPPALGDLDGDGDLDLVLAPAPSSGQLPYCCVPIHLLDGPLPPLLDLAGETPDHEIGNSPEIRVNIALADVTGGPEDDLLLHTFRASSQSNAGLVRIFEGGSGFDPLEPTVRIRGAEVSSSLRMEGVLDLDGDGRQDLVVASTRANGSRGRVKDAGEVHVLGSPIPLGARSTASEAAELEVYGEAEGDRLGRAVAGDFDADGALDLFVAAALSDGPDGDRDQAGGAWLLRSVVSTPRPAPPPLFVDAALGDDAATGLGWAEAKASVGAALDLLDESRGQAVVHVAEGTYAAPLRLGSETFLLGGYPAGGGERNPAERTSVLDATGGEGSVVTVLGATQNGPALVDGFVLTGGRALWGGGVFFDRFARGTLSNAVVTGNTAVGMIEAGGSITCTDGFGNPVTVNDVCRAIGTSGTGAGVAMFDPLGVDVVNVLVHDNAFDRVREECFDNSEAGLNCPVSWDFETEEGSGVGVVTNFGVGFQAKLQNLTIHGNAGPGLGIQVFSPEDAEVMMRDSIITDNGQEDVQAEEAEEAAGILGNLVGTSSVALDPSNLMGEDPLFLDPGAGDFRLAQVAAGQAEDSPAVDAGSAASRSICFDPVPELCLDALTTRSDDVRDAGTVDLGYHELLPNQPPLFAGLSAAMPEGTCAVRLTWPPARDTEGDNPVTYEIYRATTPGGQDFTAPPLAEVEAPAVSYLDSGLEWSQDYFYVVRARDGDGRAEANTVEVSAAPGDVEAPSILSSSAAALGGCEVEVAFAVDDACSGLGTLQIHRSEDPGFVPDPATLVAVDPLSPWIDTVTANGNWHYKIVARDRTDNQVTSGRIPARVDDCTADPPVPGEAWIRGVSREAAGVRVAIDPAPGADFHRLLRGDLTALASTYTHGAGLGPDRVAGTGDDEASCRFTAAEVVDPTAGTAGSLYYLAVGRNSAGPGIAGLDASGEVRPSAETLSTLDCTP